MQQNLRLEVVHGNELTTDLLAAVHTLCNRAYEEDLNVNCPNLPMAARDPFWQEINEFSPGGYIKRYRLLC